MQKRCALSRARICLPLDVVPKTRAGRVRAYVCGAPELICVSGPEDVACGRSRYILRQHLVADIPVEIGAAAFAGDLSVRFEPEDTPSTGRNTE